MQEGSARQKHSAVPEPFPTPIGWRVRFVDEHGPHYWGPIRSLPLPTNLEHWWECQVIYAGTLPSPPQAHVENDKESIDA